MALRTKIEPISEWVTLSVKRDLTPEARGKAVASIARKGLAEAQETNRRVLGRVPPHETFVDGRKDAPLESVNRTIVFEFELVGDVLTWIGDQLVARSPKRSGKYRSSHMLFADGRPADPAGTVPLAEEYAFTNPVPYARRLEVGKTKSGRDFLVSVPNRIYEGVAKDARAKFGNIAKIEFTYRAMIGGAQVNQGKAGSTGQPWWLGGGGKRSATGEVEIAIGAKHGRTAHNRSRVRFPTIVVKLN